MYVRRAPLEEDRDGLTQVHGFTYFTAKGR